MVMSSPNHFACSCASGGGHVPEQRGLADAGLAPDDERLAHAVPNGI
jgi:hypothetical protein